MREAALGDVCGEEGREVFGKGAIVGGVGDVEDGGDSGELGGFGGNGGGVAPGYERGDGEAELGSCRDRGETAGGNFAVAVLDEGERAGESGGGGVEAAIEGAECPEECAGAGEHLGCGGAEVKVR